MKNSFIKKVAVLSAGAVVLSSMSFLGVNAQQETVLEGACTEAAAGVNMYHGVHFGSFNISQVATTFINNTGDAKHVPVNNPGGLAAVSFPTVDDKELISVLDGCGNDTWEVRMNLTNMTGDNGEFIWADNINVVADGTVWIVDGSTSPLANSEITAETFDLGGEEVTVFTGGHTNTIWAEGTANRLLFQRSSTGNLIGGEYGVNLEFEVTIPQYQPAGEYKGTLVIDFQ